MTELLTLCKVVASSETKDADPPSQNCIGDDFLHWELLHNPAEGKLGDEVCKVTGVCWHVTFYSSTKV